MTMPESRVLENPNRVRCFTKDELMPDVLNEKWDLIRVTCIQNFNKHVQYGLSFIKVHTSDAISTLASSSPLQTVAKSSKGCDETLELPKNSVFSQFKIRSDSSDSDKEAEQSSSSLFSKWKQEKNSPPKASTNGQRLSCKFFLYTNTMLICFTVIHTCIFIRTINLFRSFQLQQR